MLRSILITIATGIGLIILIRLLTPADTPDKVTNIQTSTVTPSDNQPDNQVSTQSRSKHPSLNIPNTDESDTLQKQAEALIQKALAARANQEYAKSVEIYNEIIALLEGSQNPEELKLYAKAHFQKASLLEFNLNNKEEAIQTYENLIEKLKPFDNIEIIDLTTQAQLYQASMLQTDQSMQIYDEIIERFQNSNDPKLMKQYTLAQFAKSYLLNSDEAITLYDEMIQKLSRFDNQELGQQLYQAQVNKAYLLEHSLNDKEAAMEVYDQIIEQFSRYGGDENQERIESAMFSKSFLLMNQQNGEQAMEIFDDLIAKYQEANDGEFPKNFEYAIINNIELALISGNDDSNYHELAEAYLQNSTEANPQIEMLNILKNAQEVNQDEAIAQWQEKYKDYYFQNWSFDQLDDWNKRMEESGGKERVRKYLDAFENHNNTVVYQDPYEYHHGGGNTTTY